MSNPLFGAYYLATTPPDDQCPECDRQEANQILKGDKILFYICPACGHEWSPPSKIEFGYTYVQSSPAAGIDEAAVRSVAEVVQAHFEMLALSVFCVPKGFFDGRMD